ncbi:hypothetical protein SDC9_118765 [bioreactor metagenome]|uniref:Uncharacterized protein n=1 Tax=bioreactor metagenome TaxID=1076179 RepID=A0A645C942_9ZZZZ
MVKQIEKSRVNVILNLMILVLGLFIVSQFLTKSFDNRSKAAVEEIEANHN